LKKLTKSIDGVLLRRIVNDYIRDMEGVCDKRLKCARDELEATVKEAKLFNRLRQQIMTFENVSPETMNEVSKNK
jgi:hypothetical protein